MTRQRSRTIVLLAATALLAAALVPALTAGQEKPQPAAPAKPQIERGPLSGLGLTADQLKALESFRKARAEKRRAFRAEMTKLADEMRQLRQDPQANQAKLDALIDKRAVLMAGRAKDALRARIERDRIFTPEQLEKLRALRSRFGGRRPAGRAWLGRGRGSRFFGPGRGPRPLQRWRALRRHRLTGWDRW